MLIGVAGAATGATTAHCGAGLKFMNAGSHRMKQQVMSFLFIYRNPRAGLEDEGAAREYVVLCDSYKDFWPHHVKYLYPAKTPKFIRFRIWLSPQPDDKIAAETETAIPLFLSFVFCLRRVSSHYPQTPRLEQ